MVPTAQPRQIGKSNISLGKTRFPSLEFHLLSEAELPFLLSVRNECRHFLHDSRKFTLKQCIHWFKTTNPNFYIIQLENKPVGYFRLSNYSPADHSIYIGLDLAKEHRGKGLSKAAFIQFIPFLCSLLELETLYLEVLSFNKVARSLYTKIGFVEISHLPLQRDGLCLESIKMKKMLD